MPTCFHSGTKARCPSLYMSMIHAYTIFAYTHTLIHTTIFNHHNQPQPLQNTRVTGIHKCNMIIGSNRFQHTTLTLHEKEELLTI